MPNVSHARYIAPLQASVDHRLALVSGLLRNPRPPISISNTVFTVVQTPNPIGSSAKMLDALCTCKPTYGSARPTGTRLDTGIPYLVLDMSVGIPGHVRRGYQTLCGRYRRSRGQGITTSLEGLRRVQNGGQNGPLQGVKMGSKMGSFWAPPEGRKRAHFGGVRGGPGGGGFPALPGAENPPSRTPENPALPVSNANICPDWESY